jgi:hypothetical protein
MVDHGAIHIPETQIAGIVAVENVVLAVAIHVADLLQVPCRRIKRARILMSRAQRHFKCPLAPLQKSRQSFRDLGIATGRKGVDTRARPLESRNHAKWPAALALLANILQAGAQIDHGRR